MVTCLAPSRFAFDTFLATLLDTNELIQRSKCLIYIWREMWVRLLPLPPLYVDISLYFNALKYKDV